MLTLFWVIDDKRIPFSWGDGEGREGDLVGHTPHGL